MTGSACRAGRSLLYLPLVLYENREGVQGEGRHQVAPRAEAGGFPKRAIPLQRSSLFRDPKGIVNIRLLC